MQFFELEQEKLTQINSDYQKYCTLLTYEEVLLDKKLFLSLHKQKNLIEPIALKYKDYLTLRNTLVDIEKEFKSLNARDQQVLVDEIESTKKQIESLGNQIKKLLDNLNAIYSNIVVEINAGKDNDAHKLLEILVNGYKEFCKTRQLSYQIQNQNKSVKLNISGYNAKELFLDEVGLHKVTNGGACQVFVCTCSQLQVFNKEDVVFQTCRSSGAGGQHVNTTDSAIKATHTKTNLTAISQDERSQFQNKEKALTRLKQKVEDFYMKSQQKEFETQKKEQLKIINSGFVAKTYDLSTQIIVKENKQKLLLKDFLQGKDL